MVQMPGDATFGKLLENLKQRYNDYLKDKSLFFYCGNNFAIIPSAYVRDIYDNFQVGEKIIVNYSIEVSWG
jgi:hypothetical protein